MSPQTLRYGPHPSQFVQRWNARDVADGPPPIAVVIHGGWWRDRHDLHLMDRLCEDLAARGWDAWNLEFRRTGSDGGGWPQTLDDVLSAIDLLHDTSPGRPFTVAIGHSAGGHLALLAAHAGWVDAVVAQAPITDLAACAAAGLGEGAVPLFLRSEVSLGEVPTGASPLELLPLGLPVLVVHGDADSRVPFEHSQRYVQRAEQAGDPVTLHRLAGGDHFVVIDPTHASWSNTMGWCEALRG
ncbi:MAG: alpha/beta hydrolase family protein [Euzebya sp.]